MSQTSLLGKANIGGGFTSGGSPAGGSFGVTQQGDVAVGTTYGGPVILVNGITGATSTLATGQTAGVTVDASNNLYYSNYYGGNVVKVPFINGAYPAQPAGMPAQCTGKDTTWCTLLNPTPNIKAMAFDAAGDLFLVTVTNPPSTPGNQILELTAANLYSNKAAVVYTDANAVSSIALDSKGNLFFTDAVFQDSTTQSSGDTGTTYQTYAASSSLNELTYSGTSFAAAPTPLVSFTNAPVAQYDSVLSGVAVDSNNTVYFSDQATGVFAFPTAGAITLSAASVKPTIYQVSAQSAYQITPDGKGNLFAVAYNTGPTVYRILIDKLQAGSSAVGMAGTATAQVFAPGTCSTTFTFAANENGTATKEFASSTGSNCTSQSTYAATSNTTANLTFTPTTVGGRAALLTATSSTSTTTQAIAIAGVGQGPLLTLDPGAATAYTTGFTTPTSVSADASGNLFVADAGAGKVFELLAGSATATVPTSLGTGFKTPSGTAVDASGNLYVADTGNNQIVEIPNVAGVLTASSQSTLVASTVTFEGTVLKAPTALTVGPDGTLYIYDSGNNRIVTYAVGGITGVRLSGLSAPAGGMVVDANGLLYVSTPANSEVQVFTGSTATATLTAGLKTPEGLAVDPSGSLLIADAGAPGIIYVPNIGGTLTPKQQVTVENVTGAPGALTIDAAGNLYVADATAATPGVFSINRSAVSLNFGNVAPGSTSPSVAIYAESAGTAAITTPALGTQPAAPFSLAPGTANPCSSATLASGNFCEFSAQYSPATSATGTQTGSGTLTLSGTSTTTVTLSGNAAAAAGTLVNVITFPPPANPIAFTQTPITLYATSTSGLTVTFTVTSGPATIVGNQLTLTGVGTVNITATQAGNTVYGAATPVLEQIVVTALNGGAALATPTFSLAAGIYTFAPQSTTISDTSTGASIYYSVDGSAPSATSKTSILYTAGAAITITATEQIQAIAVAPGNTNSAIASATYTITPEAAVFTLALGSPSLSIVQAQRGAIDVVVTGTNGFSSAITFTVAGLPSGASASFTPTTVTPSVGTPSATSVLTIALAGAQAKLEHPSRSIVPEVMFAFTFCLIGWRRRRGSIRVLLLVTAGFLGLHVLSGCSSSNGPSVVSTSTVTVTATAGAQVQTATFPLTVTSN